MRNRHGPKRISGFSAIADAGPPVDVEGGELVHRIKRKTRKRRQHIEGGAARVRADRAPRRAAGGRMSPRAAAANDRLTERLEHGKPIDRHGGVELPSRFAEPRRKHSLRDI